MCPIPRNVLTIEFIRGAVLLQWRCDLNLQDAHPVNWPLTPPPKKNIESLEFHANNLMKIYYVIIYVAALLGQCLSR